MEQNNFEIPFLTKVKIVSAMALVGVLLVAVIGGAVSYQRNAKIEAAALAKTQLANAEKTKAVLPFFRDTAFGKNYLAVKGEKTMVKINVADLPATITAGLDPDVELGNPFCSPVDVTPGQWTIKNNRTNTIVASNDDLNDWAAAEDGTVTIPALSSSDYGKYTLTYNSNEACVPEGGGDSYSVYIYIFKIVPPCPTSVTLTHVDN